MIERHLIKDLCAWKDDASHLPLIVRGARQVGKSFLIEHVGRSHFEHVVVANFEQRPELSGCFETLDPHQICQNLRLMLQCPIEPGKTLLFLDEIQDCPQALRALRYFKEQLPSLHVLCAGSLLEQCLHATDFRVPVGRVGFRHLYPLSFDEYLHARHPQLANHLNTVTWNNPLPDVLHQRCLHYLHEYSMVGGLPGVCQAFLNHEDALQTQNLQSHLLETYAQDFAHTTTQAKLPALQACWNRLPHMLGEQIKYHKMDPDIRSSLLKDALMILEQSHLMHRIEATSAQGLPLQAGVQPKRFKMQHLDVGLVKRHLKLESTLVAQPDLLMVNRGALAEQLVGQELLAYAPAHETQALHFWARDGYGRSEIDFLTVIDGCVLPIEVKAGKTGRLRALQVFLDEHPHSPLGLRLSSLPLERTDRIASIPLYMMRHLDRLVKSIL